MEKEQEKIYAETVSSYRERGDEMSQDLLQAAIVRILETGKKFNDVDHFRNYLRSAINTRRIDVNQQRENLVSLSGNDKETDMESFQVSIPERDYHLYKWMLTRKNSKGNFLFSCKQRKVLAKRYLSGKTQNEIAIEMKLNQSTVSRLIQTIDRKLLSLPLRDMAGAWYHGSGFVSRSDIWQVHPDIKSTKIGYLKRYRRTQNPMDLERFRRDSARCLQSHRDRVGDSAIPVFNDTPIPQGIPQRISCNIPDASYQIPTQTPTRLDSPDKAAHIIADRLASQLPAHIRYQIDPMSNVSIR